jgi:ABC-type transport system involved in cytochrome bd biosynthesis fused ATPase/permease subunit
MDSSTTTIPATSPAENSHSVANTESGTGKEPVVAADTNIIFPGIDTDGVSEYTDTATGKIFVFVRVVCIGAPGCGKSTFLQFVSGLDLSQTVQILTVEEAATIELAAHGKIRSQAHLLTRLLQLDGA